jgi:hypothetical protein
VLNIPATTARPLPTVGMTRGHTRLIAIEVRAMPGETMRALDVDHRERVPERGGILRAAQQLFDACRGILVGWAELLGVVGI